MCVTLYISPYSDKCRRPTYIERYEGERVDDGGARICNRDGGPGRERTP